MTTGIDQINQAPQSPKSFLYTEIIKSHLGEQLSLISSYLLSHGRLNIGQLGQYTKLPSFNIKQSLVSLIQLNIVQYFLELKGKTYYYLNEQAIWNLIYSGDIIHQIQLLYKDDSITEVIQNFLQLGYLTFRDYLTSTSLSEDDSKDWDLMFIRLIQDKWLVPITKLHFQNKFDLYSELFKNQLIKFNKENKSISESKKIQEVKQSTNEVFLKLLQPEIKYTKVVNGELKMVQDIPLTFNLNRFLQRKRSLHLTELVKHKMGPLSAKIYSIILLKYEKNSLNCIDPTVEMLKFSNNIMVTSTGLDPEQVKMVKEGLDLKSSKMCTFNANEILKEINYLNGRSEKPVVVLQHSIIQPHMLKSSSGTEQPPKKKIKLEIPEDFDEFGAGMEEDDVSLVMQHLKSMAQRKFLKETSPGKFCVPIGQVVESLQEETLLQLVKLLFGPNALRIINCVRDLKLVDEKMLNNVLLMKDGTIRSNLNKLVMHNFLELQEIPKTNDRLAIRTVYLFKFDANHTLQRVIDSLTYNLGEILSNIELLKLDNKILLDKCNRDDVKGKEVEVLIENELTTLKQIYESELNDLKKYIRIASFIQTFTL